MTVSDRLSIRETTTAGPYLSIMGTFPGSFEIPDSVQGELISDSGVLTMDY
jgi:hypothetical protein